jgi:ABC-type lipoprotein export system ATPase subunit
MTEYIIKAEKIHKIYHMGDVEIPALRGVDFAAKKGEFVSIMGPSGSGKSTLLHVIGLLDNITKGSLHIKGKDTTKMSDEEKTKFRLNELGFVFQFYSLLPELNAKENVYVPQMLMGKNWEAMKKNAQEVLEMLGIGHRTTNYPNQLSGGEQQRVSIARAIVNKPEILIADEPTAALDSKSAENVFHAFRELNEKMKQTVIIVTHEETLGAKADRGIWLKDGEIVKEKTF